ncbi:hypothetical protein RDWZM_004577 [Blomia tropicalis]|uniref:Vacuolar protein sorting-associated protein 45 n=1 Tax=Blomia tropicalis TaxID=40697 RepID=A0A9Q0M7G9_BLOTA|nr:hypothetical protein RDWZM_004577 [Blomia tropicalis]
MDVVEAMKNYITEMVKETGTGIKALLMDKETISIVSVVYAQSEMLEKEVYLFELIENYSPRTESAKFVKCIVFIRPTEKNLNYLIRELKHPRFTQYYIYFNNIISQTDIKFIADVDEQELIKDVQEIYGDYLAINSHTFSINVKCCYQNINHWNPSSFVRLSNGLISLLLSLNRCPLIRYQANSILTERLAEDIRRTIAKESSLFDHLQKSLMEPQPILLILDRKMDPITPLLNQWTYQAMLHELLSINNNRISLTNVPGISKELREIVLARDDEFYLQNRYLNYGEICCNIKSLMDEFQQKSQSQKKIETIADMKQFIETYPNFKKMSGTVTKHVTLIDEISRLVNAHNLLEVSETEQELISNSDHSESLKRISNLIGSEKLRKEDALRLVLLYALTFCQNSNNDIRGLCLKLERSYSFIQQEIKIVNQIVEFCGRNKPKQTTELLTTEHVKAFTKKMIKGFKGVENIYTQHQPLLKEIIEDLYRGKLKETLYPFLGTVLQRDRPIELIVFMIGGITYEESMVVHQLNRTLSNMKILIGGSSVHNTESFLDEVRAGCEPHSQIANYSCGKNVL